MTERQRVDDRPIGDLLKELASGTQALVSKEIALAKLELRESVQSLGIGVGLLAGAAVLALVGLIVLSLAAAYALSLVLPLWASTLIVAAVLIVGAVALALLGKGRLAKVKPVPEQTIETLKEDQQWLKQQVS